MLACLHGILHQAFKDSIVILTQGMGWQVFVARETQARLPHIGSQVFVFTSLIIRQEQPQLFGFLTLQEKEAFEILLSVQGVGPKVGLAILGSLSPQKLLWALQADDQKSLTTVEGVGPKLARRLTNELRDKLEKLTATSMASQSSSFDVQAVSETHPPQQVEPLSPPISQKENTLSSNDAMRQDAVMALETLGYDRLHVYSTINELISSEAKFTSSQEVIKAALKKLSPLLNKE